MRANRAYRLIVRKGGPPRLLGGGPDRVDHVEVVEIDSGEVVLFWDTSPEVTKRLVRRIREDMSTLESDAFYAAWQGVQAE